MILEDELEDLRAAVRREEPGTPAYEAAQAALLALLVERRRAVYGDSKAP